MDLLGGFWDYVIPFLFVLTVLVFVHELGHYYIARRSGVRVEVFSIGFGPELFGWNDKAGTRWKFSIIPLGGYVRMFGEREPTGETDEGPRELTEEERRVSFQYKPLRQRAAIVSAGPLANFLFAIVILAGLFSIVGQPFTPPEVGTVQEDSAAAEAGLQSGDVIVQIDGTSIDRFEEVQRIVRLRPGESMKIVVRRDGERVSLKAVPSRMEVVDRFGNTREIGFLGISRGSVEYVRHDPLSGIWYAAKETVSLTAATLTAVGQIIAGTRTAEELGGPLRIAQISGEVAETGFVSLVWFMAILSINLGLINIMPIPMLDGGHLLFYAVEAVRGKPLGQRAQEYGFRIGLALVVTLMLFVTWNDLVQLRVVEFLKGLMT